MKTLLLCACIFFLTSCNQPKPEPGAVDNESLSHKLFDAIRDNNFEKTKILMPDKGTYRKIIKDSRGIDISEEQFDSMVVSADSAFAFVRSKIENWEDLKFQHSQSEFQKQGTLQFATTVVKTGDPADFYKFSFTSCKYNSKWFYLGDVEWIDRQPSP